MAETIFNTTPKFTAYFAQSHEAIQNSPSYSVLITPSQDQFDDFGYKSRVTLTIKRGQNEPLVELVGMLGFIERAVSGVKSLDDVFNVPTDIIVPASTETHRFFTMLFVMEEYRNAVEQLGTEDATAALLTANDVVALREFSKKSNVPELAEKTDVFRFSFMRQSDSYFAYRRAGSVLRGLANERLGGITGDIAVKFKPPKRSWDLEFTLRFEQESELPKRIAVLIGKNGVGKSQTLARIARSALAGSDELRSDANDGRLEIGRLLAFEPTLVGSIFPKPNQKKQRVSYYRFPFGRVSNRSRQSSVEAVQDLAKIPGRLKERSRWDIFIDALKALDNPETLCLPTAAGSVQPAIFFSVLSEADRRERLERVASVDPKKQISRLIDGSVSPLSSGELAFVKFAAHTCAFIENGTLLLLDEPETHLHPNFINQFVSLLETILEETGSVAVIATHSVYFVREVFREQVTILRAVEQDQVVATRPRLRTFGGDIGAISFYVFGEDRPSQLAEKLKSKLLKSGRDWASIKEEYGDELSPEFSMQLRRAMGQGNNEQD